MQIKAFEAPMYDGARKLFIDVFSASANKEEGETIGVLVHDLAMQTAPDDFYGFVASDESELLGAILFSRMRFENGINAFNLSPVAVATHHQGKGVGQALIEHGLAELKKRGVQLVCVYGDPNYYVKVGFKPALNDDSAYVEPPFALSMPFGWQSQMLDPQRPVIAKGKPGCVAALSYAHYW